MVEIKVGLEIQINSDYSGGLGNRYKITDIQGSCFEVECILFYGFEDLGDGIGLYGLGHTVWISDFFYYLFNEA